MARPERNNVDYFPFICKEGPTMYYIEEKYRNDGFATWIKILRQLAVTDYHYLNLSKKVDLMFLSSKCKVSEDVLLSIINDLVQMGEFELNLWEENRVLFSVKFVEHIKDAYLKRNNKCISLDGLLTLLESLGVRKQSKSPLKGYDNTQSKVKESREDNSKEKETFKSEFKIFDDWISWGQLIVDKNDHEWQAMRGREISQSEMDSFLSVATRNDWTMDTQQQFRMSLKGFKSNLETSSKNGNENQLERMKNL